MPECQAEKDEEANKDGYECESDLCRIEVTSTEDDGVRVEQTVKYGVDHLEVSDPS